MALFAEEAKEMWLSGFSLIRRSISGKNGLDVALLMHNCICY